MADHLAAGIVHLAVDPADVESLMAIRASSIWASEHSLSLKIWPFQRSWVIRLLMCPVVTPRWSD